MKRLKITVTDTSGSEIVRPVTSGVPIAEGAFPLGTACSLTDSDGANIPLQSSVLATWKDGSARWLLLDFKAQPPANAISSFTLTTSSGGSTHSSGVQATKDSIISDKSVLNWGEDALLAISNRLEVRFFAVGEDGKEYNAKLEKSEIESSGPVRSTVCLYGSLVSSCGARLFSFRMRASLFSGLSRVFLEPQIIVDSDSGIIAKIRELNLSILPKGSVESAAIGADTSWNGTQARLMQVDDRNYIMEDTEHVGGKAPGWAELVDDKGRISVAMRDFWQQWPKALSVDGAGLNIGLFPAFEAGTFDHMGPWYKHDYLFEENTYRLRVGQARRWQIWIDTDLAGEELALCANAPLVAAMDPAQGTATGVWGLAQPAGTPELERYENWVDRLCDSYVKSIEDQRDYGAMNWGDWWGERGCNWGNNEYDTPVHLLTQFARTGNPKYFHLGDLAARHTAEVDVVHFLNKDLKDHFLREFPGYKDIYPSRPGMVHEHSIGHVGAFHSTETVRELYVSLGIGKTKNPYLCLDPYNLGHIFTKGMMYAYFLTGDPWIKETLEKIRENLVKLVEDRAYPFKNGTHCGRMNGWTMLALAATYELDHDPRCLHAMQLLADDALSEQDPNCGGWLYELPWGHCFCTTCKHVGEAGFLCAIRINGLSRYYDLTGDERIPQVIERAMDHQTNDTWREGDSDWRYTSCPATKLMDQIGVVMEAYANSARITGNKEHLRILEKAWRAKFERISCQPPGQGKDFSLSFYGCNETISVLSANGREV